MSCFSERIAAERAKRKMSQAEFSKLIGLKQGPYCRYERGDRTPDIDTLCKIADALHVSTDWLLCRTDKNSNGSVTVTNNQEAVAINSHNGGNCANCPLAKAAGVFISKKSKK